MSEYTEAQRAEIRRLNDELRQGSPDPSSGIRVLTQGVNAGGEGFVAATMAAVAAFDDFTEDNDPHLEHDFGALDVEGERLFFKCDYYNLAMDGHSPDPADPAVTRRVLTIMLASEY